MKENLNRLLRTMNQIEVKGEGNLNKLLGCIQFVQAMMNDLKEGEQNGLGENAVSD